MKRLSLAIITLLACAGAQAAIEEKVTMNLVTSQGVGQAIGTVTIVETGKGLEFTPDLKALPPGEIIANAWPLLVIAVITLGLAVRFVRSRLQ